MAFENIPAELRALKQWVVWRSIVNDGRITKPPFNPRNPNQQADITNSATWGSFDEARTCFELNSSTVSGIGFVFTEQDDYFGIDIDDEAKVSPQHMASRQAFVSQILENVNTYTEVSPSGTGLHLIAKGKLPVDGRRSTQVQIELYGAKRYFTMTGNVYAGRTEITHQQEFIDTFIPQYERLHEPVADVANVGRLRPLDLTDEEVLRRCANHNPSFAPRYNGQVDCGPGRWSETFMMIVGLIDQHTGDVEQVRRLVMNSPMVQNSPPSSSGESRVHKAHRNLMTSLSRVRNNNTAFMTSVEHGKRIFENLEKAKKERAEKEAEAIRAASEAVNELSKNAAALFDAFPFIEKEHMALTRPKGVVGEFVLATEKASFRPFTKFAIPATLACLAGVLGRGFKLPSGMGINLNFILAAPSNAGKTTVMKAWERFINDAGAQIQNTLTARARNRILNSSASSIQSVMEDFQASPSIVWFVEECFSQLETMNNGRSPTEAQFRDAYNQLYDCGEHGRLFTGPRSMTLKRANIEPINNLCVSTFWTTTASKLDVFAEDALDGFLSRVTVIRHNGISGAPVRTTESLPTHLQTVLVQRLAAANLLDETYTRSATDAARMITYVSTVGISDLVWDCILACDQITNAAIENRLPPVYGAISRLPMLAQRIAAILAIMENPFTPSITTEQYKWAFGYLLNNIAELFSALDHGELGAGASDEVMAVVRTIKEFLKKNKKAIGIGKSELKLLLRDRAPFNKMQSRYARVSETLLQMTKDNLIAEIDDPVSVGKAGRPKTLVVPMSNEPIWVR